MQNETSVRLPDPPPSLARSNTGRREKTLCGQCQKPCAAAAACPDPVAQPRLCRLHPPCLRLHAAALGLISAAFMPIPSTCARRCSKRQRPRGCTCSMRRVIACRFTSARASIYAHVCSPTCAILTRRACCAKPPTSPTFALQERSALCCWKRK